MEKAANLKCAICGKEIHPSPWDSWFKESAENTEIRMCSDECGKIFRDNKKKVVSFADNKPQWKHNPKIIFPQ